MKKNRGYGVHTDMPELKTVRGKGTEQKNTNGETAEDDHQMERLWEEKTKNETAIELPYRGRNRIRKIL